MNALFSLPAAAPPVSQSRAALAQRIAALLRDREANQKALITASARWRGRALPPELTLTYRGPFGSLAVEVDGEELREMLPEFSPQSRRGRRLRHLLRLHDEHYARAWADRETSGVAAAIDERNRIEGELAASANAALHPCGHGLADVALQAAAFIAAKLGSLHDCPRAPSIVQALLELAARESVR